jgi:hypothetical protein
MKNNIKEFCELYKEKIINDKDITDKEIDCWIDFRERISFSLSSIKYCPGVITINATSNVLIELDDEDVLFLYNKYKTKLNSELEAKIDKIKQEYKNL